MDPSAIFSKIKIGYGLVGKVSYLLACAIVGPIFLGMMLVYYGLHYPGIGMALIGVMVAVWGVQKIFDFAAKHPVASLTEGVEYARIFEIQQTSKDPTIIDLNPAITSNNNPPKAISSGGINE